jgi:protein SCO1/2
MEKGDEMTRSHPVGARFDLTDHHGNHVTNASYQGRYPLVFFGFTHCAVVCPRALGKLSAALAQLGEGGDQLVPLYITVDPERDNPDRMKQFLEADYPRFTGLTGTPDQLEAARREFRVFAVRKEDPNAEGGYQVPHSAITYLLDRQGEYLTHFTDTTEADELARRLSEVLKTDRVST